MTERQLTYDELVERNQRLANKIVNMGDQFQETLRAEIRKAKREAWSEGNLAGNTDGYFGTHDSKNPYEATE